ncbi:MAG: sulfatase-like hydrolase/transferase [Thermoanaerobaculia bacterium]|nr:sulfatase-like hydrolase/transferase [Thermoanaerobaculia bacterium]
MLARFRLVSALGAIALVCGLGCGPAPAPWPAAPAPLVDGPILLVTFESLRADFVASLGGAAGDTPALDALVAEARASGGWAGRAVAPSSWTAPVLASLHTGLAGWHHEVLHAGRAQLIPEVPTLAERFSAAGWSTQAFAPGRRLSPKAGFGRGFGATSPVRDDGKRLAVAHLRALAPGRQFLWVHLSRPDSTFERNRPKNEPAAKLRDDYRAYVRWLDHELGLLLAALEASGQADKALVAVVGCLGQDLGDPGPTGVGHHLERSLIEVPWVIKLPTGTAVSIPLPPDSRPGTTRLAATLLNAAGLSVPPAVAPGLFAAEGPAVVSELYAAGGTNQFSLVAGDLQLLRRVPLVAPEGDSATIQRRFQVTLPLSGAGGAEDRLVRWLTPSGTTPVHDPAKLAALLTELEQAWLAFRERERTPVAEGWAERSR